MSVKSTMRGAYAPRPRQAAACHRARRAGSWSGPIRRRIGLYRDSDKVDIKAPNCRDIDENGVGSIRYDSCELSKAASVDNLQQGHGWED
ncbi:MAG: hypothetical protein ABJ011_07370, partial [Nitratireductor sp.]